MACADRLVIRLVVLLLGVVASALAAAQEPAAAPVAAAAAVPAADDGATASAPRRIDEVGPEIFYLQDDGGRLVPVPGFSYRDFVELFRMQEGLPGALQPPAAVLERLLVRLDLGQAAGAAAPTCPAVVECTVLQTRGGWVHVPIELQGLLLSGAPRHEGPGRMVIDSDQDRGGYRLWFDHVPEKGGDASHVVVLEGTVAVDASADAEAVALRLAPATTSTVELVSARKAPAVSVQPAPPPQRIATTTTDDGSRTTVSGLAGDVRIRIADAMAGVPAWNGVPEAAVESLVRIDGRHAFTDATVRLANLPPTLRTVRITLPPRAVPRGVRPPAAIVARGGSDAAPTVDVAIDPSGDGEAVIDLQCERPLDPSESLPFEAAGFAVEQVEPWRQWGRVSLVVEGEWRAEWSPGPGVRRVDPPASARRQGFVAAFAYDTQPASLPVRVRPRQSRVVIEPDYRYTVGATRLELLARLRITTSGGPATSITVAIDPAWTIDEAGPAGIVDVGGVTEDRGTVTIPLTQPITGDAVVELRASRVIDRDATRLAWKLPVPQANLVAPAAVVVESDSDIEVLPDTAASVGLVRQSATAVPRGGSDSSALVYRLDLPQGTFTATRRFLERRVTAAVSTRVEVDASDLGVAQTMRLNVVHVPLQYVELWVPEAVNESGTLEGRQGETLLDPFEVPEPAAEPPVGREAAVCLRAILFEPVLGSGELTVSYRLPMQAVPEEATVAVDLPLVLPAVGRIGRQSAVVEAADTLAVDIRGDAWRPEAGSADAPRAWAASKPQELLPLAIAGRQRTDAAGTVVEAAWLQTRLLAERREDAATYVIGGNGAATSVSVPVSGGVEAGAYTARLDGATIPTVVRKDGTLVVDVPAGVDVRPRLLEIRWSSVREEAGGGWARAIGMPARLELTAPLFTAGIAQRRFYWEIAARPDEHLLGTPAAWTSQQQWRWQGTSFQRLPVVSHAAIAAWIEASVGGAGSQRSAAPVPEPAVVERRLVYSGVGPPGAARVWVVPIWCLVLIASGTSLAAGLAVAYRPRLRRTAVVLPCLAAVVLAAAAQPDLAAVLGQAAVPGIVLSLVAWLLRGLLDRPGGVDVRPLPSAVSPSSMTRSLGGPHSLGGPPSPDGPPSLVVSGSSLRREDSLTAITKQLP